VFKNPTLTAMTQMVHIAWTAAAFANKDIVDGMNDLVSEKQIATLNQHCFQKLNAVLSH